MNAKKLVKWGVALTSTLILGGVIVPVDGNLANTTSVVYAEEAQTKFDTILVIRNDESGNPLNTFEAVRVYDGSDIVFDEVMVDGYEFVRAELVDNIKLAITDITLPYTHKYVGTENGYGVFNLVAVYRRANQPAETPTEKPVEQPVEKPVETPTEQPTEKPATTPTDQPVDQPVATKPVEKPVETPIEQPAEQPVEIKPAETLTAQPTEKPTATSLLADNTASKAQTGATTDKKKVDNSTPSTDTVKPEEGSQATAKTLPKTGDSSSMLLVLGGLLSGLSGLGLAATSRKRD